MSGIRSIMLALCLALWSLIAVMPAQAAKPEFSTITFDGSQREFFASCDGFDILLSPSGTIQSSFRSTTNGSTVIINRYRLTDTWTNSVTGRSISSPDVGIDKLTIAPDGSGTLAIMGLYNRLVVPGQGRMTIDAGRVKLFYTGPDDTEPDVLFEAGQHSGDTFVSALCGLLAG